MQTSEIATLQGNTRFNESQQQLTTSQVYHKQEHSGDSETVHTSKCNAFKITITKPGKVLDHHLIG